jgi:2-oxoglutarate dehydrogenase E1 component
VISLSGNPENENGFGANDWLVDEMYAQYKSNPDSVDKAWWPILENYKPTETPHATTGPVAIQAAAPAAPITPITPAAPASTPAAAAAPTQGASVVAKTTRVEAKPQPIPAQAPVTGLINTIDADEVEEEDQVNILKAWLRLWQRTWMLRSKFQLQPQCAPFQQSF